MRTTILRRSLLPPIWYPIIFFLFTIFCGSILLHGSYSLSGSPLSWVDAVFTATSATCVTGLTVVDTGTTFNRAGQTVILLLIQLGGIGVTTFSSFAFYLWRRQVSLTDRIVIGQGLLHNHSFHIGGFLIETVRWTLAIECAGALLLFFQAPKAFPPFSSLFHAVSAFCNAGFSLDRDNLVPWQGHWGINLTIMGLIILGGLGFSVLGEIRAFPRALFRGSKITPRLSWYSRVVCSTTLFLILSGTAAIYCAEFIGRNRDFSVPTSILTSLFQSVTCRTAGFNTIDISHVTNVSLLFMIVLMFIGGAPGSCAGGIKVTSFRALGAFAWAQILGRRQTVIRSFAVNAETLNKALTLLVFSIVIITIAIIALNISEAGAIPHPQTRGLFMDILFEAFSAFGTVGLSTGLTPKLTDAGKVVIILLMFIGRIGPIVFLGALQSLRKERFYSYPEEGMLIG